MKKLLLGLLLSGSIASNFISAQIEETNISNELNGESQVFKQDDTLLNTDIFDEDITKDTSLDSDLIDDNSQPLVNKEVKENKMEDTLLADESEDIPAVCPALFDDLKEETFTAEKDDAIDSSLENVDKTPVVEDIGATITSEEIDSDVLNEESSTPQSEVIEDTTVDMEV